MVLVVNSVFNANCQSYYDSQVSPLCLFLERFIHTSSTPWNLWPHHFPFALLFNRWSCLLLLQLIWKPLFQIPATKFTNSPMFPFIFKYISSLTVPKVSSISPEDYCLNFSTCALDSILVSLEAFLYESISLSVSESFLLISSMSPSLVILAHQYLNIFKILLSYKQSENQIKQK